MDDGMDGMLHDSLRAWGKMPAYTAAIMEAADLFPERDEWDANPEYLRGMCELIARMHALPEVETGTMAAMVQRDIGKLLNPAYDGPDDHHVIEFTTREDA